MSIPQAFNLYITDVLALLGLLSFSGLCSAAEVAFFSLSHKQITQCKNSKHPQDHSVIKLLQQPKRLLATILVLNNLANVAIVILSTYLLWTVVGSEEVGNLLLFGYTFTSTVFIVLFGEIIPKIYANQNNLYIAKKLTTPLQLAVPILYPLYIPLLRIGQLVGSKRFRDKYELSIHKLHRALELTTTQDTSTGEREILQGVVNFSNLTAKQTMQPRIEIVAIDIATDFHQLIELVNKSGHSRFPAYKDTIDNIEGVLHVKDLLSYLDKDKHFDWQPLLHKSFFVPENKKIDALLLELQKKGVQMAIVVDEYGGTSGLITMEDIVEEIIGDIVDEFDRARPPYRQLDAHTFIFEGKVSLHDFCKVINEPLTTFEAIKGESESLAGLLLELYGRIPLTNEKCRYQRFNFTIVAANLRKIKAVRVEISPQQAELPLEEMALT